MDGEEPQELRETPQLDFPVVGIGASAGGLEAVSTMFQDIGTGTGMAYVLVMHLDPDHESMMAELLSRKTHITVRQIMDGEHIEVDCLHIIPPGYSLSLSDGVFKLDRFEEPRGLRRPIDSFFASLAETQGDKAACVVLSGTGADGTAGLRVIKELGGVCAVQSPEEARYDGMPFSALATKLVDFTLHAEDIIPRLKTFFEGAFRPVFSEDDVQADVAFSSIFSILRKHVGHDFAGYKRSTLSRRLNRRLQVLEFANVHDYVGHLKNNKDEQHALAHDFLINVTSFFRDRENFELLRQHVIVPLIEKAEPSDELRVWVPGSSSGQEAYSLAMLIDETCEQLEKRPLIQIFATDIDEAMIAQARRAQYPVSMFAELPKKYQDAYTMGLDGKFEIVKRIREMVRFSIHNLIQDPPFSKIDLISCRNLLIYLGEHLQSEILPLIHFSLRPDAYLFLGTSESVTRRSDLFSPIDQRARIFRRQTTGRRVRINLPLGSNFMETSSTRIAANAKMAQERDFPRHRSLDSTNATIYEQYAPPFVRVAHDGRIIDSSGDLSLFLMSRPGEERSIHTLAREAVRDSVLPLISDAINEDRRRALKDVHVASPFGRQRTDIIAHPMKDDTVALIFIVKERLDPVVDEYAMSPLSQDRRIADLQEELQATRLMLKSKVEEIETANEELKSSNEEMMSMNEELQSANEELTTANEELKNKIDELSLANADLDNFMQSADLAMIVLDRAMRIRHITEAARKIVPIMRSDAGRVFTEFNTDFEGIDIASEIRRVMETNIPYGNTVTRSSNSRSYFVRITPYFFVDGSIEGVSITILDMTEEVQLRHELHVESQRLKVAMKAGRMGLVELDVESGQVHIDLVSAEQLGLEDGEASMSMDQLTQNVHSDDLAPFHKVITRAAEHNEEYEVDFRVVIADQEQRWIRTRGVPYTAIDGRKKMVGPTLNISDENAIERREILINEMSHRVKNLFAVVSALVQSAPKHEEETLQFADDLVARIAALGDAYDLARKNRGLSGVRLKELIENILRPHVTGQICNIDGPALLVSPNVLNTLTLILHELTTNAIKYGALTHEKGELNISWTTDAEGNTRLIWSEVTPDFEASQAGEGFGSRLIQNGVMQLRGRFEQSFHDHGLEAELFLRFDSTGDGSGETQ